MKCRRCGKTKKEDISKNSWSNGQCNRCHRATRDGYKIIPEQLKERNFIRDGIFLVTDKKCNEWIVDQDDFEKCSKEFWNDNGSGYARSMRFGYLHKFICPQWDTVDHINRNPYDNRKANLRDGKKINNLNKKSTAQSGYKGVHKIKNKWQARPYRVMLGTFDTKEEAHHAVIKWAEKNNLKEFYLI